MSEPSRYRLVVRASLLLLGAVGIVAGVYVVAAVPPSDDSFYPKCQFHYFTGLHCPGCGTTRALNALLNGRIGQALAYNPLAFIILPVLGGSILRSLITWHSDETPLRSPLYLRLLMWLFIIAVLSFWVLRNLPWHPFTLLAPHEI